MDGNDVYEMFRRFEDVVEAYGPFQGLDVSEVHETPADLIWSSGEFDDGEHLINGRLNGSAIDLYLRASKPCHLEPFKFAVISTYCFECTDCYGEPECLVCEDEGMVEVDFTRYSWAFEAPERNPETIWSFRKPLGHDYSQD